MNKQLAPVALFVYNRPEKTRAALVALENNVLASDTTLFIFSDAAKSESQIGRVAEVRKIIKETYNFNKIIIVESKVNKGLSKSIINGVSVIISKFGKIIVLEDDLVTHPRFLNFMNKALDFYFDNPKIFSVTGYNYPKKILNISYEQDIYFFYRQCSWGWATWIDRWSKVDWKMKYYKMFKGSFQRQRDFNKGGRDLSFLLELQWHHLIDSWAIRWNFTAYKQNAVAVYPSESLIDNTGFDGSGTHSGVSEGFSNNLDNILQIDWTFISNVSVDLQIEKKVRELFSIDKVTFLKLLISKIFSRKQYEDTF